jgi:hypothetical protein
MSNELVTKFWDLYETSGLTAALDFAKTESGGDLETLKDAVAELVTQGQERGIDIAKFLDALAVEEMQDAVGTDNDGAELLVDSSDDDDIVEDEAESAEERAPDQSADAPA